MLITFLTTIAQINFGDGLQPKQGTPFFPDNNDKYGVGALDSLENMVSFIIGVFTVLGGIFFIYYFVFGAFKWITAAGDSGQVQKARDQMTLGVVGLIVLIASYSIIGLIGTVIGLDLLNPAAQLGELRNTFLQ
jgi:hypothetical protein